MAVNLSQELSQRVYLARLAAPPHTGIPAPISKATVSFNQTNTEKYFQKQPELIRKQALKKQIKMMELNLKNELQSNSAKSHPSAEPSNMKVTFIHYARSHSKLSVPCLYVLQGQGSVLWQFLTLQ